jgi:hypothetical protein
MPWGKQIAELVIGPQVEKGREECKGSDHFAPRRQADGRHNTFQFRLRLGGFFRWWFCQS